MLKIHGFQNHTSIHSSPPPQAKSSPREFLVNTGGELGENALRTIEPLGNKFRIIRFRDLETVRLNGPT